MRMTEKQVRNAAETILLFGQDPDWELEQIGADLESIKAVKAEMERIKATM